MIRRFLTLLALVVAASVPVATAASTGGAVPPRQGLLNARAHVQWLAKRAGTPDRRRGARHATKALAAATVGELWIDPEETVAPAYGTNVFRDSAAAVKDLTPLEPASRVAIGLIVAADRGLARIVISEARAGNNKLLSGAQRALKAAGKDASTGHPAGAVKDYQQAWELAFTALTRFVVTRVTRVPHSDVVAAAENALGSKRIALAGPQFLHGVPRLTKDGKPELFFAGSEACPFCGIERWGMIVALAQFGTFSNLHLMQSDTTERPADRTLTFYRSRYRSRYISFVPVEVWSNVRKGFKFLPLQSLTKAQSALLNKYDRPEQTPFIDVASRFVKVQSTTQPPLIAELTWTQIADSLTHPGTESAQAVAGTAEVLTAELCTVTNGRPKSVCSAKVVHDYQAALPRLDGHGGGCPTTQAGDSGAAGASARAGAAVAGTGARAWAHNPPKARADRCHTP